jgi:hypothetical protein
MRGALEAFLGILAVVAYFALVILVGRWLKVDPLLWVILAGVPIMLAGWVLGEY